MTRTCFKSFSKKRRIFAEITFLHVSFDCKKKIALGKEIQLKKLFSILNELFTGFYIVRNVSGKKIHLNNNEIEGTNYGKNNGEV